MIIDLERFVAAERPEWQQLEKTLQKLEDDPGFQMDLAQLQNFHHLYERASADLAKISTFSSNQEIRQHLESLVRRAYGEIHEVRQKSRWITPWKWFFSSFPPAFRRHPRSFALSIILTLAGALFGGAAITVDPGAKEVILPFSHLQGDPSQRVKEEEKQVEDRYKGHKTTFSSYLITHNTQVAITSFALGMTWGVGTIIILFYNGVILGTVGLDYIMAGETRFLLGWLMPHGVIEIPAILIASQAGLILAGALMGRKNRNPLMIRLREVSNDMVILVAGAGILLIWAGFVEAFLSQYHEPFIPYNVKIAFGTVELILLALFLSRGGRKESSREG